MNRQAVYIGGIMLGFKSVTLPLGMLVVLAGQMLSPRADAVDLRHQCHSGCVSCAQYYYPTVYQQGALRVEITGPRYNVIEAYYESKDGDLAFRHEFDDEINLHVHRIFLSSGDQGLFVVRHGINNEQVSFIGWNSSRHVECTESDPILGSVNTISSILGNGGGPIRCEWKTPNIVRLSRLEKTCLVRWLQTSGGAEGRWQVFGADQKWKNIGVASRQ